MFGPANFPLSIWLLNPLHPLILPLFNAIMGLAMPFFMHEVCGATYQCMMLFHHHFAHPQAWTLSLSWLPNTTTSGLCPIGLLPSVLTLWYQDLPYLHCLFFFGNSMQRGLYWWCRWENGSMCIPPMETSFGHWNTLLLSQDENPIIGRIFAGNPNIRFFRCLPNRDVISSLNPPNSHDQNGGTYVRIGGLLRKK